MEVAFYIQQRDLSNVSVTVIYKVTCV